MKLDRNRFLFLVTIGVAAASSVIACAQVLGLEDPITVDAGVDGGPLTMAPPDGPASNVPPDAAAPVKLIRGCDGFLVAPDAGPVTGCPAVTTLVPRPNKPLAPKQPGVCTQAKIDAIAAACGGSGENVDTVNGAACKQARATHAECAKCLFSDRLDSTWKVVVLASCDPSWVQLNQAGCIEHVTTVPGCGQAFLDLNVCLNTFCPSCGNDTETSACVEEVMQDQCSALELSEECATDALETNKVAVDECFSKADDVDDVRLFKYMAKIQCPP